MMTTFLSISEVQYDTSVGQRPADLLDKQHKELIKRVGHFLKALETQRKVTMALYSHTKNGINAKSFY
ncbi:MAG: hypothetical protein AAB422_03025 [Planctomycetota bacterium]